MPDPRDELDDLRDLWGAVTPPERGEELAAQDPETRAAVGWMQAAWQQVPVPTLSAIPRAGRTLPLRRWRIAAAAILLIAAGVGFALLRNETDTSPVTEPPKSPQVAAAKEPELRVLIANEDRVVMESGPVTLVLVRPEVGG